MMSNPAAARKRDSGNSGNSGREGEENGGEDIDIGDIGESGDVVQSPDQLLQELATKCEVSAES
jgi:hypothetical protein